MKKILLGILLSTSTAFAVPTDKPILYGPGAIYCKEFTATIDNNFKLAVFFWVQGYVSARGVDVYRVEHRAFDPLPKEFTMEQQREFVAGFCKQNGDKDMSEVAEAMVQRLRAMEALR